MKWSKKVFALLLVFVLCFASFSNVFFGESNKTESVKAQVNAVSYYYREAAIDYAEKWWNGRNSRYNDYGDSDCANFVSQSLMAGGLGLSSGVVDVDDKGCIISSTNLNNWLVNSLGAQHETWTYDQVMEDPRGEPLGFIRGDVAIFGNYNDPYWHAVFAVIGDDTHYAEFNAHSNDRQHKTIQEFFSLNDQYDSVKWDRVTFYQIPDSAVTPPPPPTITSPGSHEETGPIIELPPTMQWQSVSNADYYVFWISEYPYGSSYIIYTSPHIPGDSTSFTLPSGVLNYDHKYRWNMHAYNSTGSSSISNTLYFQTQFTNLPPTITSPLPSGTQNQSYPPYTFTATGGTTPYTWSVVSGTLPLGLNLSSSGVLSGTPTNYGDFSFRIRVMDNNSLCDEKDFTLHINAPTIYTLTVNVSPTGAGTVTLNPPGGTYTAGTTVTLTANPSTGYHFASWSGDIPQDHETDTPLTITIDSNKSITANFAINTYTITSSSTLGGSISPSGTITVNSGESKTFTITPYSGYKISDVKVDGVSVGAFPTYTFNNITANHTIEAIFEKEITQTVIILQIGNPTFTVNGVSNTLDSPPIIKNNRTLLPIRAVIEALNGTVGWDAAEKKVTVSLGSKTIELWIGKSIAKINGIDTPIDSTNDKVMLEIINGRTMPPLRFVTEQLGAMVSWEQSTQTITITYTGE